MEPSPVIWILLSPRAGDNTQLTALANQLNFQFVTKRLIFHRFEAPLRIALGTTLCGLVPGQRGYLAAPPPDLVFCAGRPNEAVALWIRRHLNPNVKIVYVGFPWAKPDLFDLVITTPQYRLPSLPNVLHNALPVHDISYEKLAKEAALWESEIGDLPKPRIAVLAGGRSGPYLFSAQSAARLAQQASMRARAVGGSLLVSTSPRTSAAAAKALFANLTAPSHCYAWQPKAERNPFYAYLALAKEIIVTADSVSMLTEACAAGKPVFLFDTEVGRLAMRAEESLPKRGDRLPPPHWRGADLASTLWRVGLKFGPDWWTRDIRIVHRYLIETGRASWLGDPLPAREASDVAEDMERTVAVVRTLISTLSQRA